MNKLIYISGQISGLKLATARVRFKRVEKRLQSEGWEVINPFDLGHMDNNPKAMQWGDYLLRDLHVINTQRPELYVLSGWEKSSGSRLEVMFASKLKLKITFQ
jgi:hypothetical protein